MNELKRLKAESGRLDAMVDALGTSERLSGSQLIRKAVVDGGHTLSQQDESVLDDFAAGKIGLAQLADQFQGRI